MPDRLPIGPYRTISLLDGAQAPWYLLPFDKRGVCEAPATRDFLAGDVQRGKYTDVFVFSHGWNNDWADANLLYDKWLAGYSELQHQYPHRTNRKFRPLFVGVIWPSTALVFSDEQAPAIAGGGDSQHALARQERLEIQSLADGIAEVCRARFYELTQRARLSSDESLELGDLLSPLYHSSNDEVPADALVVTPEHLRNLWAEAIGQLAPGKTRQDGDFGFAKKEAGQHVQAASGNLLDPRWIVRLATVLQMKDRAGTVGSIGVGPLLDDILAADRAARVHLIGHSYGAKVVLSALCYAPKSRPVDSVLLLQPAISYLCFVANAVDKRPGGYADAPSRVVGPIISTFSSADFPLHWVFHLAVRRSSDAGELQIAGAPPSRYCALGGYGPASSPDSQILSAPKTAPDPYQLSDEKVRVIGINCSPVGKLGINGHGDISNPLIYWMLKNQIDRED